MLMIYSAYRQWPGVKTVNGVIADFEVEHCTFM